jgi:hypothetical protein
VRRPLSILLIGWLFILTGAIGFVYHLREFDLDNPFVDSDRLWILTVRLLAIIGGILLIRAYNVGRWLLLLWLAYHVVISYFHDWTSTLIHAALLVALGYFLFRKEARDFFADRRV